MESRKIKCRFVLCPYSKIIYCITIYMYRSLILKQTKQPLDNVVIPCVVLRANDDTVVLIGVASVVLVAIEGVDVGATCLLSTLYE